MILKLAMNRINIHKLKKIELSLQDKKKVATLLEQGKEEQARVQTVSIIYEDYSIEVFNLVELYCQQILQRMDIVESQKYLENSASTTGQRTGQRDSR